MQCQGFDEIEKLPSSNCIKTEVCLIISYARAVPCSFLVAMLMLFCCFHFLNKLMRTFGVVRLGKIGGKSKSGGVA